MEQQLIGVESQEEASNSQYYKDYCRLYIANVVLQVQMKELRQEKQELFSKLTTLEQKQLFLKQKQLQQEEKKKRTRRVANQIERIFQCPVENCHKSYGSDGSLTQHLKIKHTAIYEQMGLSAQQEAQPIQQSPHVSPHVSPQQPL